ncbi:MAG: BlaI/MecI/CopY family transcriptional regulator [Marinifilaceae bacterium]|jgi:predicted transcriptional regulator
MEKLTKKEERAMQALWKIEKGFVKDILAGYDEPKPHYNTLSSLIRGLEEKGYVGHKAYGKTHEYFPLISQETYTGAFLSGFVGNYFENSYKKVVSFFAKEEKLSVEDLKEIIEMIEKKNEDE